MTDSTVGLCCGTENEVAWLAGFGTAEADGYEYGDDEAGGTAVGACETGGFGMTLADEVTIDGCDRSSDAKDDAGAAWLAGGKLDGDTTGDMEWETETSIGELSGLIGLSVTIGAVAIFSRRAFSSALISACF